MVQWMKMLAGSLCILTILTQLVPENRFAGYVRFYAGLLFFLLALRPALELFGSEGELERYLQLEFLKEEYYDLESAAEGLNELKNEQIQNAYQQELNRQITEIAAAYGLTAVSVQINYGDDGYSIESVHLIIENPEITDYEDESQGNTKWPWPKEEDQADMESGENEQERGASEKGGWDSAMDKTKSEIAGLYLLPASGVEITVQ